MRIFWLILLGFSTSALAEERSFEDQVLAVILANPEIILVAMEKLEAERLAEEEQAQMQRISAQAEVLFADETTRLVEFVDYRCGYCARSAADIATLPEAEKHAIRIIELPILGDESRQLAEVALGVRIVAGDDAYRDFHFALFEQVGRIASGTLALNLAADMGFDRARVAEEAASEVVAEELEQNLMLARRLGVTGTPAFVSRQNLHEGLMALPLMRSIINDQEKLQ